MKQVLIVTVGLPRSGKTTWAKQFAETMHSTIVNPDSFRLEMHGYNYIHSAERLVWANIHLTVPALFRSGNDFIIIDATNVSRKRRDAWRSDNWTTFYKLFETPKEVCIERAIASDRLDLISVIERMANEWEDLEKDELELKTFKSLD